MMKKLIICGILTACALPLFCIQAADSPKVVSLTEENWNNGVTAWGAKLSNPAADMKANVPRRIWQAKLPAPGKERAYPGRIVCYSDKWIRHDTGNHVGPECQTGFRFGTMRGITERDRKSGHPYLFETDLDLDGDGRKTDYVQSLPWNMDFRLSPVDFPWGGMLPERISGKFYGGISAYLYDSKKQGMNSFLEIGINPDHHGPWPDFRAEDHPFCAEAVGGAKFQRSWFVLMWKKEDFLNGGDKYRVSFDENSLIASITTRDHWFGFDQVRFVVQDPEGFWISDMEGFDIPKGGMAQHGDFGNGRLFKCYPVKHTWARYTPEGHKLDFDPDRATFAKRDFRDVRAVGFYIAKRNTDGGQVHIKWYGLEVDAVINRPEFPSTHVEMVKVEETGVPPFYMANCETPYALHKQIQRWGNVPFHTLQGRYVYDKRGDMGSMRLGDAEHGQEEPVTNLKFLDMLAFCNTLSELEGKEHVYYTDPEFKEPFKNKHLWTFPMNPPYNEISSANPTYKTLHPLGKIYVKWAADGYRLPTPAEWVAASDKSDLSGKSGKTQPVTSGKPNSKGIYGLFGNAWEMVWTYGNAFDPLGAAPLTALGGDFLSTPEKPVSGISASAYGDIPYDGAYNIGYRMVCREKGLPAPPSGNPPAAVPAWTLRKGERLPGLDKAKSAGVNIEMAALPGGIYNRKDGVPVLVHPLKMAKTETTYAQWKRVQDWAEANGYEFGQPGEMGSMFWYEFPHTPDEPVASITWFDMITWCNALSEMEGRQPVFYCDKEFTQVIRTAYKYRPCRPSGDDMVGERKEIPDRGVEGAPWIFVKFDADGYRMPTRAEFEYACSGGNPDFMQEKGYPWGSDIYGGNEFAWSALNSGGRSHPVAKLKPNPFGLYDLLGNATELSVSAYNRIKDKLYDVNNPKDTHDLGYGNKNEPLRRVQDMCLLGGSLIVPPTFNDTLDLGANAILRAVDFPDFGFRTVRCDPVPRIRLADGKYYVVIGPQAEGFMKLEGKKVKYEGDVIYNAINIQSFTVE